jgi:beta-mannanase
MEGDTYGYQDAPFEARTIDTFESHAGKRASIVHWGQPWWHAGKYQPFYADDYERVRLRGAIPMINWSSWDYSNGVNQPDFRLAGIADGRHDDYIRQWALGAKAWGHPLFLRFDHEMNGWWQFPWSEQVNGNRPGDFVRAWRHVHDIFVEVGATNVTWVWCPNIAGPGTTPLASLYPGDQYVDWVGMDGYNWGTDRGNTWQSFAQVFGDTYDQLRRLAPAKPIMLGEWASSENGGSKAAWIADALGVQLPLRYPMIKAIVWFNWNDDDPQLSWTVESSSASAAAFAQGIASGYYAGNRFADLPATTIAPPK